MFSPKEHADVAGFRGPGGGVPVRVEYVHFDLSSKSKFNTLAIESLDIEQEF